MRKITQSAVLLLLAGALTMSCNAADPRDDWIDECVGRLQFSIPTEADVAALPPKVVIADFQKNFPQPEYAFADGQPAGWSAYNYLGRFTISQPLEKKDKDKVIVAMRQAWTAGSNYNKKNNVAALAQSVSPHSGNAEIAGEMLYVDVLVGDILVTLTSHVPGASIAERKSDAEQFIAGLSPRAFGNIPDKTGICLPNLFIADTGQASRSIGTTYRLKRHPDITIWLQDRAAARPAPDQNPAKFTAKSQSDFFWTQRYGDSQRESVSSYWSPPYRSRQFAGSPAVESFVELVRKDGTEDFGYLAVARGNPDVQDKPDVMLYVIRDAKNAKSKGVEPMNKDDFLKMARAIADSVKLRPTR